MNHPNNPPPILDPWFDLFVDQFYYNIFISLLSGGNFMFSVHTLLPLICTLIMLTHIATLLPLKPHKTYTHTHKKPESMLRVRVFKGQGGGHSRNTLGLPVPITNNNILVYSSAKFILYFLVIL